MSAQYWKASTAEQLEACFRFLREFMPDAGWRIDYAAWKDARSLSQNALSWIWYAEIAKQIHDMTGQGPFDPQDIHDRLLVERYGYETAQIGSVHVQRVPRSSKFDKGKMTEFLKWVEVWALDHRVRLSFPAHAEYMKLREAVM